MSSYLAEESTFQGQRDGRDEFYDEVYGDLCQDYDFLCLCFFFSFSRTVRRIQISLLSFISRGSQCRDSDLRQTWFVVGLGRTQSFEPIGTGTYRGSVVRKQTKFNQLYHLLTLPFFLPAAIMVYWLSVVGLVVGWERQ